MNNVYATRIKFEVERNSSEYYPIIIEPKKKLYPFSEKDIANNIIFLPSGENEILIPGNIKNYNFYSKKSDVKKINKLDIKVKSELSSESTFLYLTRWLTNKCKRYESNFDIYKLRNKGFKNLESTTNNIFLIYLNHLKSPYASYVIDSANKHLIEPNIEELYLAAVNLSQMCFDYDLLNNEKYNPIDIIVPAYGKFDMTLRCILSIYQDLIINRSFFQNKYSVKIIIAEDDSKDLKGIDEMRKLSRLNAFNFLENEYNLGFLENCNNATEKTRDGSYIVFLNNDVKVLPGWLVGLVETYEFEEDIGLVGSKLIYPDNKLQEAGGIIWNDASAWNYGKFSNPNLPEFNFSRNSDYISGASIMIKKELFVRLNKFDILYKPAYYEDTDLCMQLRKNDLKVIYQPQSQAIHIEGESCGTETGEGIKLYQVKNKEKFFDKWGKSLKYHFPNGSNIWSAISRGSKGNLLIVESLILDPDGDAGSLYMINICFAFKALGYNVTYIPANNFCYMRDKANNMGSRGIEVLAHPRIKSIHDLRNFQGNIPIAYQRNFDIVLIARPENLEAIDLVKDIYSNIKIFYYTHDLHYVRLARTAKNELDSIKRRNLLKNSEDYRLREKEIIEKCDFIFHVSEEEEVIAQKLISHRSSVLPPVSQIINSTTSKFKNRFQLLFLGNYNHMPNIDGIIWFIKEVFPKILNENNKVYLNIAGGNIDKLLKKLKIEIRNIKVIGYVEDLSELYNSVGIGLAPLITGAGVKGKVLSYLSAGLPVVSTKYGSEGIVNNLRNCNSLKVTNNTNEFAEEILKIIDMDKNNFEKLSAEGKKFENDYFGPAITIKRLKSALLQNNLDYKKGIISFNRYSSFFNDIRYDRENSFTYYSNELAR